MDIFKPNRHRRVQSDASTIRTGVQPIISTPQPHVSLIDRISLGLKTPDINSPKSGMLLVSSPNATLPKRISGPQAADAEQLQKVSAHGFNTVQQMLFVASQEFETLKQEYQRNPTEENHTSMEQQAKIVRRLEILAAKQRPSSLSSDAEILCHALSTDGTTISIDNPVTLKNNLPPPHPSHHHKGGGKGQKKTDGAVEGVEGALSPLARSHSDSSKLISGPSEDIPSLRPLAANGDFGFKSVMGALTLPVEVAQNSVQDSSNNDEDNSDDNVNDVSSSSFDKVTSPPTSTASMPQAPQFSMADFGGPGSPSVNFPTDTTSLTGQQSIISMEDGELSSDEESFSDQGVFSSFSQLRKRPAHLSVFIYYLISNSDPSTMVSYALTCLLVNSFNPNYAFWRRTHSLFYVVTDSYNTGALKDMRRWAYEIYATFLADKAVLKIDADEMMVEAISVALLTKYEKEDVMRNLFEPVRTAAVKEINKLLEGFRSYRKIGLGSLYGDQDLKDHMDHTSEMRIVEKLLLPHFETFVNDEKLEKNAAIASALATFFRQIGFSNTKVTGLLERCPSFNSKDSKDKKIKPSKFKKQPNMKSHNLSVQQYYSVTLCVVCGTIVGAISSVCYQCKNCELNVHRNCVENIKDVCSGKKIKQPNMFTKIIIRKPSSAGAGCSKRRGLLSSVGAEDVTEALSEDDLAKPGQVVNRASHVGEDGWSGRGGAMPSIQEDLPPQVKQGGVLPQPPSKPTPSNLQALSENEKSDYVKEGHVSRQIEKLEQGGQRARSAAPSTAVAGPAADHKPHSRSPPATTNTTGAPTATFRRRAAAPAAGDSLGASGDVNTNKSPSHAGPPSLTNNTINRASVAPELHLRAVLEQTIQQLKREDSDFEMEAELPALEIVIGRDQLKKLKIKEKKRQEVINELFYTERAHVRNLKILQKLFYQQMNDQPPEFLSLLFPNIDDMIDIHGKLSSAFKKMRKENCVIGDIADALVNSFCDTSGQRFKRVSAIFCEKQSHALEVLKVRQRKDLRLNQILQEVSSNPVCRRLELKDLLPTAMQRLTKYPLLVENLLKHTQADTEEFDKLTRVEKACKDLLSHVNEAVQIYENHRKLGDLQRRLDKKPIENSSHPGVQQYKDLDLMRHRLIYDGGIIWRISRDKLINVHCVLLNDILLLLQKQDDRLVLRCQSMFITQGKEETKMTHSPIICLANLLNRSVATDKRAFFLVSTVKSSMGPQIYELVAPSKDEKNKWCKYITEAVEANKSSQQVPYKPPPVLPKSSVSHSREAGLEKTAVQATGAAADNTAGQNRPSGVSLVKQQAAALEQQNVAAAAAVRVQNAVTSDDKQRDLTVDINKANLANNDALDGQHPTEKLRQVDRRILRMMLDKARLRSQSGPSPAEDYRELLEMLGHEARERGTTDAQEFVLASIAKVDELLEILDTHLNITPLLDHSYSVGSPTPTPGDSASVSLYSANQGSGDEASRLSPVQSVTGVELQHRLNEIGVLDDDNSRLRLELVLAHRQLDHLRVDRRRGDSVPHENRPLSLVSTSSGDEIGGTRATFSEEESDGDLSGDRVDGFRERGSSAEGRLSSGRKSALRHDSSIEYFSEDHNDADDDDDGDDDDRGVDVDELSRMLSSMKSNYEQLGQLESVIMKNSNVPIGQNSTVNQPSNVSIGQNSSAKQPVSQSVNPAPPTIKPAVKNSDGRVTVSNVPLNTKASHAAGLHPAGHSCQLAQYEKPTGAKGGKRPPPAPAKTNATDKKAPTLRTNRL